jgi:transcriptional regulator with XRE-family HTH domain
MAGGKALAEEINDRVRAALRELMHLRGWDQATAGDRLGVRQQSISQFLGRTTGASLHLAWEIAKASRKTLDELLTGKPDGRFVRFEELPGWREHESEARRVYSHVPASAFDAVRNWRTDEPFTVNVPIIGDLAEDWGKTQQLSGSSPPPQASSKKIASG